MFIGNNKASRLEYVGLVASLLGNVVLGLAAVRAAKPDLVADPGAKHDAPAGPTTSTAPASTDEPAFAFDSVRPFEWNHKNSPDILQALHRAGFARDGLESLAYVLAHEVLKPEIEAVVADIEIRPWEQGGRMRRMSSQQRMEIAAINERNRQMAAEAMAQAGIRDATDWKYFDNPRFKGFSTEKIAALAALDSEYANDMRYAIASRTMNEAGREIRREREDAVRQLLTEEEYEAYQSYYSPLAKRIQGALIGQEISDAKYLETYQKLSSSPDRTTGGLPGEVKIIRSALDANSATLYAMTHDNTAKPAMALMQKAGIPPSLIVDYYLEYRARNTQAAAELYVQIAKHLTPDQLRALDRSPMGQRSPANP